MTILYSNTTQSPIKLFMDGFSIHENHKRLVKPTYNVSDCVCLFVFGLFASTCLSTVEHSYGFDGYIQCIAMNLVQFT